MKYPKSIEAAIKYVLDGAQTDMPVTAAAGGRPSSKRIVNGVILDRHEYDVYICLVDFWKTARELSRSEILSDEEFIALQKMAAPKLTKRMIDMALVSDSLKDVRAVAADLADRGFGKAAASLNINISSKDIRAGWKQLEDRGVIDVGNMVEADVMPALGTANDKPLDLDMVNKALDILEVDGGGEEDDESSR